VLSPRGQQSLFTLPAFRGLGEAERQRVAGLFRAMKSLRDIDRRNLASGWAASLRKSGGESMEHSISQFTSLIHDVKKGDTMSFIWRPAVGIEVATDGEIRGTVPGDDFARMLFTVWFGPEPGDANLKRGMLGK
jgi:hypothetical protein